MPREEEAGVAEEAVVVVDEGVGGVTGCEEEENREAKKQKKENTRWMENYTHITQRNDSYQFLIVYVNI